MPINIFELAGYVPNLFEYEPFNKFASIDTILLEEPENNCNNSIFHEEPETLKPLIEYY